MTDKIEKIENSEIRRTGWTTVARRCPVHEDPLELCFDETDYSKWTASAMFDHDDNRIRWRCERCIGSWVENHFLRDDDQPRRRLLLACPSCGSMRLDHQCDPGCCESHACLDCRAEFDAKAQLVRPGRTPGDPVLSNPRNISMSQGGTPLIRSGFTRSFRACDQHGPMELGFITMWEDQPPTLLAWYCAGCNRTSTEPSFRTQRREFVPDAVAALICLVTNCGGRVVTQDGEHRCTDCDAVWAIQLVPGGF